MACDLLGMLLPDLLAHESIVSSPRVTVSTSWLLPETKILYQSVPAKVYMNCQKYKMLHRMFKQFLNLMILEMWHMMLLQTILMNQTVWKALTWALEPERHHAVDQIESV